MLHPLFLKVMPVEFIGFSDERSLFVKKLSLACLQLKASPFRADENL